MIMRIVVLSDTHGNYFNLESIILRNTDADWRIHLGDGELTPAPVLFRPGFLPFQLRSHAFTFSGGIAVETEAEISRHIII